VQELKEWAAVMDYVRSFEDTNSDGLPDIPERYSKPQGRIISESSLNPVNLLWRGSALTWGAFAIFLIITAGLFFSGRLFLRKISGKK
jgi:hypothetical protein